MTRPDYYAAHSALRRELREIRQYREPAIYTSVTALHWERQRRHERADALRLALRKLTTGTDGRDDYIARSRAMRLQYAQERNRERVFSRQRQARVAAGLASMRPENYPSRLAYALDRVALEFAA